MPRYLAGIVDTVGLDRTATATGLLEYTSFLSDVEDTAAVISEAVAAAAAEYAT
jgi:hypothetical protein